MKNRLLVLLLMAFSTTAVAQNLPTSEKKVSKWQVGVQWAIIHEYIFPVLDFDMLRDFRGLQASVGYRIQPRLELQAGMAYLRDLEMRHPTIQAASIPLAAHYYFLKPERRFQLYGHLGATVLRTMFAIAIPDSSGNSFVPVNVTTTAVYATYGLGTSLRIAGPVVLSFEILLNKRMAKGTSGNNGMLNLGVHYRL